MAVKSLQIPRKKKGLRPLHGPSRDILYKAFKYHDVKYQRLSAQMFMDAAAIQSIV